LELSHVAQSTRIDGTKIEGKPHGHRHRWRALWRSPWTKAAAACALVFAAVLAIAADYIAHHLTPVLHERIIATLEHRFHAPVELDSLDVSLLNGIQVHGSGLRVLAGASTAAPGEAPILTPAQATAPPMLSVRDFTFRTSLHALLHLDTRIETVNVEGLELHIPPHTGHALLAQDRPHPPPPFELAVKQIFVRDARVYIETNKPGKDPLEFDIDSLILTDVGARRPFNYIANLTNPRPRGHIHATGHFGPWQGKDPRATPIDGDFTFSHADLSTIRGIGGTLDSTGRFTGKLGELIVDGTTTTPDFSLDISGHTLPLTTTYHAIVDGTSGDTTLAPVNARLGNSSFICSGTVMKVHGRGHDIALTVNMPHGRIEDLLLLSMKQQPPVMRGAVTMQTRLHIPPGHERVAAKLQLQGHLRIDGVEFASPTLQDRIDSLSMRAQGKPRDARTAGSDHRAEVASQMAIDFNLDRSVLTVPSLHYAFPGAQVQMAGAYQMAGELFEFKGHVRTDATASQMVTGWKSMLLRPFDRFLKKDGAGVQLPISVTGEHGNFRVGLALHNADETPAQMRQDLQHHAH
jgi:hypothetical protein